MCTSPLPKFWIRNLVSSRGWEHGRDDRHVGRGDALEVVDVRDVVRQWVDVARPRREVPGCGPPEGGDRDGIGLDGRRVALGEPGVGELLVVAVLEGQVAVDRIVKAVVDAGGVTGVRWAGRNAPMSWVARTVSSFAYHPSTSTRMSTEPPLLKTLIAPSAPTGTVAMFAPVQPAGKLIVEAVGNVVPLGKTVKSPWPTWPTAVRLTTTAEMPPAGCSRRLVTGDLDGRGRAVWPPGAPAPGVEESARAWGARSRCRWHPAPPYPRARP